MQMVWRFCSGNENRFDGRWFADWNGLRLFRGRSTPEHIESRHPTIHTCVERRQLDRGLSAKSLAQGRGQIGHCGEIESDALRRGRGRSGRPDMRVRQAIA